MWRTLKREARTGTGRWVRLTAGESLVGWMRKVKMEVRFRDTREIKHYMIW